MYGIGILKIKSQNWPTRSAQIKNYLKNEQFWHLQIMLADDVKFKFWGNLKG